MFCKHCGLKLDEGVNVCPRCGTNMDAGALGVQNFKVTLPSHEQELLELLEQADAKKAASDAAAAAQEPSFSETDGDAPFEPEILATETKEPAADASSEPAAEKLNTAASDAFEDVSSYSAPQTAAVADATDAVLRRPFISDGRVPQPYLDVSSGRAPMPVRRAAETAAARRSRHALTAIVCVCLLALVALLGVRLTTTLFDSSNSGLEPVSLSVLTDEEKQEVLSFLSAYAPLYDRAFSPKTLGVGAFFELLDLNQTNNLYAASFGQPTRVTETPDPLNRFADESGTFSYYRIDEKDLNALAERFGVSLPGSGNNSRYYYYDGAYYFLADAAPSGDPSPDLHISKAQHTEDGSYYVALADLSDINVVYAIVSRNADAAAENGWTLTELSPEPLFREDGSRAASQTAMLNYEMRHEEISAVADDRTVVATYVLDYPYFTDATNETAKTVNALYAQMLKSYNDLAATANDSYNDFVKRDYDKRMLPSYTYMVSTVTYNADGTLSILDELTEYQAAAAAKARKAQQTEAADETAEAEAEGEAVSAVGFVMPTITYSGTTIDTASGAFLRRDDVFSGDYELYQSLLYRIFAGASEEELVSLLSVTPPVDVTDATDATDSFDPYAPTATPDVTAPSDSAQTTAPSAAAALPALNDAEATIAQQIYAAPWVRTQDGVRFCYFGNGYHTFVTLPQRFVEDAE